MCKMYSWTGLKLLNVNLLVWRLPWFCTQAVLACTVPLFTIALSLSLLLSFSSPTLIFWNLLRTPLAHDEHIESRFIKWFIQSLITNGRALLSLSFPFSLTYTSDGKSIDKALARLYTSIYILQQHRFHVIQIVHIHIYIYNAVYNHFIDYALFISFLARSL